jgi:hypothetical protein
MKKVIIGMLMLFVVSMSLVSASTIATYYAPDGVTPIGQKVLLQIGDIHMCEGKEIEIVDVSSTNVIVQVDGISEIISIGNVELVSGKIISPINTFVGPIIEESYALFYTSCTT